MSSRDAAQARRKPRKRIDPLHYALYCNDEESLEDIEEKFRMLDKRTEGASEEELMDAAREVFRLTATPEQMPNVEMWFELHEGDGAYDDDEDVFEPSYGDDGDELFPRNSRMLRTKGKQRSAAGQPTLASAAQIEHLGAGVDLWPAYKVRQVRSSGGVITHKEFPNRIPFRTRDEFIREIDTSNYTMVDTIDVDTFRNLVGDQCDAILMDAPFGRAGWTYRRFRDWLSRLKPHLDRCFIVVWTSVDDMDGIMEAFKQAEFKFCDSMAVELLDSFERPHVIRSDWHGLPRDSRMAVMFRTTDIVRSDLKQQRVKDTGFGVVAEGSKTYGRLSMPMTIHTIIETMLPPRKGTTRVFVELWPSFFHRRANWVLIDEKPSPDPPIELDPLPCTRDEQFD